MSRQSDPEVDHDREGAARTTINPMNNLIETLISRLGLRTLNSVDLAGALLDTIVGPNATKTHRPASRMSSRRRSRPRRREVQLSRLDRRLRRAKANSLRHPPLKRPIFPPGVPQPEDKHCRDARQPARHVGHLLHRHNLRQRGVPSLRSSTRTPMQSRVCTLTFPGPRA